MEIENTLKNIVRTSVALLASSYILLLIIFVLISNANKIEFWIWGIPFLTIQFLELFYLIKNLRLKPIEIDVKLTSVIICMFCFFAFLISTTLINHLSPTQNNYFKLISLIIAIIATFITISSLLTLKNKFSILPEANSLVNKGIYKYLRHPLYFAYILSMISSMLIFNDARIIFANSILILLFITRAKLEEKVLEANIAEYKEYKKQTPFIPWISWL